MKKLLLLVLALTSFFALKAQNPCFDIFISEYVEGWSNNKAIELYNGTDRTIDLSTYTLSRYSNGSTSADPQTKIIALSGTMAPKSVFVIVIDKRIDSLTGQNAPVWEELQEKADLFLCPDYNVNNVMYFNGNDALVLKNGNFIVDVFGRIGEDPGDASNRDFVAGWNDVGPGYTYASNGKVGWTKDNSLIRKPSINIGDDDGGDVFNVSLEWDSIPAVYKDSTGRTRGNWATVGNHVNTDCGSVVSSVRKMIENKDVSLFPVPAKDQLTIQAGDVIETIEIRNLSGAVVLQKANLNSSKITLNVNPLHTGYYLVSTTLKSGGTRVRKLTIQ